MFQYLALRLTDVCLKQPDDRKRSRGVSLNGKYYSSYQVITQALKRLFQRD